MWYDRANHLATTSSELTTGRCCNGIIRVLGERGVGGAITIQLSLRNNNNVFDSYIRGLYRDREGILLRGLSWFRRYRRNASYTCWIGWGWIMTECWWSVIKGFLYPNVDKSRGKCWHQDCSSNPTWFWWLGGLYRKKSLLLRKKLGMGATGSWINRCTIAFW